MDSQSPEIPQLTMENLFQALQQLQKNLNNAQNEINGTRNQLSTAQAALQKKLTPVNTAPRCKKPD